MKAALRKPFQPITLFHPYIFASTLSQGKLNKIKLLAERKLQKVVYKWPLIMSNVLYGYLILIAICFLFLTIGCEGLQVNVPLKVESVKREEASLLVLVDNKSAYRIKITYPISTDMLKQNQYTEFSLPKAGNYKVVVTAYAEDPDYRNTYKPVETIEIPIFLNGYDTIRTKGGFVGYNLEVTDGMIFPGK